MHKVASDTVKVKRWLAMASNRCERMPHDHYDALNVDAGTWSRWASLEDERLFHVGMLPTVLSTLSEPEMETLFDLIRHLAGFGNEKPGANRAS